ncbi:hypothetical protein R6Q59_010183 [Mikania micrantha]
MGSKQRAQKRGKAAKGSQKGTPTSQRTLMSSIHVPDLKPTSRSSALIGWQESSLSSSPADRKIVTMGDAARNTERHMFGWGSSKLRDQSISFVSAGTLHQDLEHIHAKEDDTSEVNQRGGSHNVEGREAHLFETAGPPNCDEEDEEEEDTSAAQQGMGLQARNFDPLESLQKQRSISLSSSSSEAEQIIFRGRSKAVTPHDVSLNASVRHSRNQSPAVRSIAGTNGRLAANLPKNVVVQSIPIIKPVSKADSVPSSSDRRVTNSRLRKKGWGLRRKSDLDEQEAIMRDYIANMAMDDTEESGTEAKATPSQQSALGTKPRRNETIRYYDGAGEENVKVQIQSASKKPLNQFEQAMDWNSEDLQDFDELSTSDEEVVEVSQVLRQRERASGIQYLVTPGGLATNEAKWILHNKLISESAHKEIAIFQEIQAMEYDNSFEGEDGVDEDDDEDETTDEELEEAMNDLIDHIESEDDENARIMKHTAQMSDEQIARALAKQEELGMGGDELMLFTGDVEEEDEDENIAMNDVFQRNDNFISFSLKQHTSNRGRSKQNKKKRDSFPSASAFADALDEDPYGGFDVMDFDRPSLRPRKKGRKSDFLYDLELEDEDLREQLISTWTKDRDKKAQRKRDKEEARMAALLECADRGDPASIKAEIRRFLVQDVDTLRLAPMESYVRASVHRLAKALKLNSRSEGKEGTFSGRYPVLTKTARTPVYSTDTIWEIDALLNTRKFFPKNAGYKKEKMPRGTKRSLRLQRSGGISGASYMNGEVVGASAPEIGADNKGRAMLEKMGWSSGMAIGAEGNKGSLDVVKHVFKTSRAGLG